MKQQFLPILLLFFSSLSYAQNVEIPDNAFLHALINEGVDVNGDSLISYTEAEAVIFLNVSGSEENPGNISDMTGIEAFINLDTLYCSYNQLTSLDFSNNIALKGLDCLQNSLISLDVSNNTNLTGLDCHGNKLSTLDVSNNTALTGLSCAGNELKELNISNNTNLKYLWCFDNQITELDVSNNKALEHMFCSKNQIISLDVSENTSLFFLFCGSNQLSSLDLTNNLELFSGFPYHANVFIDNMPSLKQVCIPENIELCCYDTTGSPNVYFTTECNVNIPDTAFLHALIEEGVDTNSDSLISYAEAEAVGFLDVSGSEENPGNISDMTGIEAFVNLEILFCWNNNITSLDLSHNIALVSLDCRANQLAYLDVSNNIDLGWLTCSNNKLTSINVSKNVALIGLDCSDNQLASLDVTKNINLNAFGFGNFSLDCSHNLLTNLDITNNINIKAINCAFNNINILNISNNIELTHLYCDGNEITSLDIRYNSKLYSLCLSEMLSLVEVCVWWESSTPPDTIRIDTTGSPNVYFTTECSASGIIENNYNPIAIYPNPVKDILYIKTGNVISSMLEIYSINGILLFKKELYSNSEVLDISNYKNGIYMVKIIDDKALYSRRLIISR